MITIIVGLFANPKALLMLIVTIVGGFIGIKGWANGKKARKNQRIVNVLKGKELVGEKTLKVDKGITKAIKEIEDEEDSKKILARLNRMRPSRKS